MKNIITIIIVCLLAGGCAVSQKTEPLPICKGMANVDKVLERLAQRRQDAMPVRAGGKLTWRQYEGKKRTHRENLDVRLRFYPPDKLYFRGDILGGEIIRLGKNEKAFWLRIKADVNGYWSGSSDLGWLCDKQLMLISPDNIIEALGTVNVEGEMTLSNDGPFDILTSTGGGEDEFVKKIYISCCDYRVRKIEYLTAGGSLIAAVELDNYSQTSDNVVVPTRIRIAHYNGSDVETELDIKLKNVKSFEMTQKKLDKLFKEPGPKGMKNVFELNEDCEFIRQ